MSKDMWEFDDDGEMYSEKCIHGFLPELFSRWKEASANHVVSIILFARIFYPNQKSNSSAFEKLDPLAEKDHVLHTLEDSSGRLFNDFYRVIIDWETWADWSEVLKTIKHEFYRFEKDVLSRHDSNGSVVLLGENSHSSDGNILEAINLALNPFDKHFIDRDLLRTGLSIVLVTPGVGFFETEKEVSRITSQRMTDNGLSLDLVCLSKPPLFSTPLFRFNAAEENHENIYGSEDNSSSYIYSASDRISIPQSLAVGEHSDYISTKPSQPTRQYYWIPQWIDCSYWSRLDILNNPDVFRPRCKMPDIQVMGSEPIIAPLIDDFIFPLKSAMPVNDDGQILPSATNVEYDAYDDAVFESVSQKVHSNLSGSMENRNSSILSDKVRYDGNPLTKASSYSSDISPSYLISGQEYSKKKEAGMQSASYDPMDASNYTSSMNPIKIRPRNGSPPTDYITGRSMPSTVMISPGERFIRNSPRKTVGLQSRQPGNVLNPLRIGQVDNRAYHPWKHVLPNSLQDKPLMDWKNLCMPACLPITTDYFPTQEELSNLYQEYTYSVSWADDSIYQEQSVSEQEKVGALLTELISQRLAQGYQLITQPFSLERKNIPPQSSEKGVGHDALNMEHRKAGKIPISEPHYLSLGNHVHRLFYDSSGKNVEVKLYFI